MFTFVRITYKVLSVTNIAVEKKDAVKYVGSYIRIPSYFLGSCIHHNKI